MMKEFIHENIIWFVAVPTFLSAVALIKHYFPSLNQNNPVEKAVESEIKSNTGIDLSSVLSSNTITTTKVSMPTRTASSTSSPGEETVSVEKV